MDGSNEIIVVDATQSGDHVYTFALLAFAVETPQLHSIYHRRISPSFPSSVLCSSLLGIIYRNTEVLPRDSGVRELN